MRIFGLKIMTSKRYDEIVDRIADCGKIYRQYSGDDYHTEMQSANVKLSELNRVCLIENLVWQDIKDKLS